jgi:hypothetical protein
VFENWVLRRIFGRGGMKWQEGGENCITRNFVICSLQESIIRIIKSRRMRWTGHVERMGEKRNSYRLLVG